MRHRAIAMTSGMVLVVTAVAFAQGPGQRPGSVPPATGAPVTGGALQASVETADVAVVFPDRYSVPVVLEPNRKVFLVAASDGVLKSISAGVGANVREASEVAQLDRAEASAKLKIAAANVKECKAEVERTKAGDGMMAVAQARQDAAEARAELAQLELDRCTLRAPFGGKILAAPVSPGQYVNKGNTLAELADYSILKVLVPVDRTQVKPDMTMELIVEGKPVAGKVTAIVPLPEAYAALRELATPWAAAWVNVNNANGALDPGQRVRGPFAPTQPITAVPNRAVKSVDGGDSYVQVVRFNNVLDVPVHVIGDAGYERTQVSGAFLPTDAAIVESSIPMSAGTVIRFSGDPPVSGTAGANTGSIVDVTPPVGGPVRVGGGGTVRGNSVAPIGSPDINVPKPGTRPGAKATTKAGTSKPAATKPAAKSGTGTDF